MDKFEVTVRVRIPSSVRSDLKREADAKGMKLIPYIRQRLTEAGVSPMPKIRDVVAKRPRNGKGKGA